MKIFIKHYIKIDQSKSRNCSLISWFEIKNDFLTNNDYYFEYEKFKKTGGKK